MARLKQDLMDVPLSPTSPPQSPTSFDYLNTASRPPELDPISVSSPLSPVTLSDVAGSLGSAAILPVAGGTVASRVVTPAPTGETGRAISGSQTSSLSSPMDEVRATLPSLDDPSLDSVIDMSSSVKPAEEPEASLGSIPPALSGLAAPATSLSATPSDAAIPSSPPHGDGGALASVPLVAAIGAAAVAIGATVAATGDKTSKTPEPPASPTPAALSTPAAETEALTSTDTAKSRSDPPKVAPSAESGARSPAPTKGLAPAQLDATPPAPPEATSVTPIDVATTQPPSPSDVPSRPPSIGMRRSRGFVGLGAIAAGSDQDASPDIAPPRSSTEIKTGAMSPAVLLAGAAAAAAVSSGLSAGAERPGSISSKSQDALQQSAGAHSDKFPMGSDVPTRRRRAGGSSVASDSEPENPISPTPRPAPSVLSREDAVLLPPPPSSVVRPNRVYRAQSGYRSGHEGEIHADANDVMTVEAWMDDGLFVRGRNITQKTSGVFPAVILVKGAAQLSRQPSPASTENDGTAVGSTPAVTVRGPSPARSVKRSGQHIESVTQGSTRTTQSGGTTSLESSTGFLGPPRVRSADEPSESESEGFPSRPHAPEPGSASGDEDHFSSSASQSYSSTEDEGVPRRRRREGVLRGTIASIPQPILTRLEVSLLNPPSPSLVVPGKFYVAQKGYKAEGPDEIDVDPKDGLLVEELLEGGKYVNGEFLSSDLMY
ncbi:hypothetical protein M427DRAFT_227738 [Gonapodya prolifera JEL478]|uniref:SH3 domain-containing protein n=1 Tax=Gonapodya prolifera (strain JEL478) TaxID=1344416 RepID=A0A138ZZB1_GONPJ|nr:hypothetical protein M427DRAFT_227738 [Gonapodya prolifera JEL478]|eukprot:KXS09473.1 hypothetical protein M427DRAFT_227738 [Gonapodya prolifera JEL478]